MVITGLRAVMGSWKIIEISLPLISLSLSSLIEVISSPRKSIEPLSTQTWGAGNRPITERAVNDFPDPLSPTMQSVSPDNKSKSSF